MTPVPDEYETLLLDVYQGELFGESFFGTMADAQSDDAQRAKLRALQRVEAQTAARLRPLVLDARIVADPERAAAEGVQLAAAVGATSWTDFLAGLRGALPTYLASFQRLQAVASDPHDPVLADLVAHEQAIDRFAELELEGRSDDALAVLHAHLDEAYRDRLPAS